MLDVLNALRGFDRGAVGLDELVALDASARLLRSTYGERQLAPPQWLLDGIRQINLELEERKSEYLQRELVDLKERLEEKKLFDQISVHNTECRIREIEKSLEA